MHMPTRSWIAVPLALACACGSTSKNAKVEAAGAKTTAQAARPAGTGHCAANDARHEVSEYDTSGDSIPDVRKVFLRIGDVALARLVLVCRESDLNSDGAKDVVRYYTEEGRPLREESDRNFDGRMDELTFFQNGQIVRQEFDSQADGKIDTKVFFENGKPLRTELDLAARSSADHWQPNRWEYFEDGRMVRMGTDLDGDGKVDRWDRDTITKPIPAPEAASDPGA